MATPFVVLKFGGTSVSSRRRWDTILAVVQQRMDEGVWPFVVCSAVSGVSRALAEALEQAVAGDAQALVDDLRRRHLDLAATLGLDGETILTQDFDALSRFVHGVSLLREESARVRAQVLALGELMATRLGAAFIASQGLDVRWLDARDHLVVQEAPTLPEQRRYLSATCDAVPDPVLQASLAESGADVYLTQGFIARNDRDETVLLGWGGSDTSAAYFAAMLEAERLEIWTDVPGMFTANPREIPSARLLRRLDYAEAQELATTGATVLHPRCIHPVQRAAIPLYVKSTEAPGVEGTVVSADTPDYGAQIKAIVARSGVTLIAMETVGMWQEVGFLADVFATFKAHGLSVDLVATSETNVTVSLDGAANALDPARVTSLLSDLSRYCKAKQLGPCAVVSLVGRHIRSLLHELGPAFDIFQEHHVYQVSQASSDLNFSFVVDEDQAPRLVRKLHAQLFGRREQDDLLGPTWRELATTTGDATPAPPPWWERRRAELLALATAAPARYVYDEDTVREAIAQVASIDALDRIFYAVKANEHPDVLAFFHDEGLGFECVSPEEMDHVFSLFPDLNPRRVLFTPNFAPREEYAAAFDRGVHVTLDNLYPLEAWPEVFRGRALLVRLDPGRGHGHHKYVRTAGRQSKFGVTPEELDRLASLVEAAGAQVVGFHAHVGSGILTPETWAETAIFLQTLTERFPDVTILDLGGGLGVAERHEAPGLDVADMAGALAAFKQANPDVRLWLEPGRFLVAGAGVLLARVTQLKQKGVARYVGVATGMNSLLRPALYGAYHEIVNLTRLGEPLAITADVVGPICETGDVLGYGRRLPETQEGDVILIATAGAYGRVMSNHYNRRAPAGEVVLRSMDVKVDADV